MVLPRRELHGIYISEAVSRKSQPCVVYLHSHGSNCVEGKDLYLMASRSFSVCLFDFTAHGQSEGTYTTVGITETQDLESVLEYLKEKEEVKHFFLWGRSMGAVSAIRHSAIVKNPSVLGMVLDAPFTDIKTMIEDLLAERGVPRFITSMVLIPIGSTLEEKTGVHVLSNQPIILAPKVTLPLFIIVGKDDTVAIPSKVRKMFELFPSRLPSTRRL